MWVTVVEVVQAAVADVAVEEAKKVPLGGLGLLVPLVADGGDQQGWAAKGNADCGRGRGPNVRVISLSRVKERALFVETGSQEVERECTVAKCIN